jgi:hypothetical protein
MRTMRLRLVGITTSRCARRRTVECHIGRRVQPRTAAALGEPSENQAARERRASLGGKVSGGSDVFGWTGGAPGAIVGSTPDD